MPQNHIKGYTLLEIMIVTALLSAVLLITFDFMARSTDQIAVVTEEAWLQSEVQNCVDSITSQVRESSAGLLTLFRFTDPPDGQIELPDGSLINATQVAICYPTPRDINGNFIFTTGGSSVSIANEPVWQGVRVLAYYQAGLWEYTDYNYRIYDPQNPIVITGISSDTITLSDGTTFNRGGPAMTNQTVRKIMGNLAQIEIPNFISGSQVDSLPMNISVMAQTRVQGGTLHRGYQVVTATMITDVLTRNKN